MGDLAIGWPQGIYLALVFMSFGYVVANNGKPRDPYNSVHSLISIMLGLVLLWWGGFFTN